MGEYEMFKTTLMGGYDKDDVIQKVETIKDSAFREKNRLEKEIKARDEKIVELTKRLELKESQKEKLERDVTQKYQKYVDNYEKIGSIILNAQIQADEMISKAQKQCEEMLKETEKQAAKMREDADREARARIDQVQKEVNETLADGKKKYIAVQDEMNEIVELINQAQKRFMSSYKEVHRIVSTMPDSLRDMGKLECMEIQGDESDCLDAVDNEDALDEAEDLTEEEMEKLFRNE